jgi:hypothetical protein
VKRTDHPGRFWRREGDVLSCSAGGTFGQRYTEEESQLLCAIGKWQRKAKRKYPSHTDVLAVLKALGYRRLCPTDESFFD